MKRAVLAFALSLGATAGLGAADALKVATDDDVFVVALAGRLGYLGGAGIEVVPVSVEALTGQDYLMQEPMTHGRIDVCVHWFQHTVFGARHHLPITAVMLINDAPAIRVMVANRVKAEIRSPADFRGRRIAEGAAYGTKAILTGYLAKRAGVSTDEYTPVFAETAGREEAVLRGLREGKVDVMTFEEPVASALQDTGMVTTLYDLRTRESTERVLGAAWPAQSVLFAPGYIAAHPDLVRRFVEAMVRTMRFVNSHGAEAIAALLPDSYYAGQDRAAAVDLIRKTLPSYARGDYAFSPSAVRLEVKILLASSFDDTPEGRWRRTAESPSVDPESLYSNRFVAEAMRKFPGR